MCMVGKPNLDRFVHHVYHRKIFCVTKFTKWTQNGQKIDKKSTTIRV
ncbi:hypothetical protein QE429_000389 [Bacillus sp. SORGH_AS 510]|nr:hypothetical protein [Bacillus sp. SORGH_AS_0510]